MSRTERSGAEQMLRSTMQQAAQNAALTANWTLNATNKRATQRKAGGQRSQRPPVVLDQLAREVGAHAVELLGAVRSLADQHNLCARHDTINPYLGWLRARCIQGKCTASLPRSGRRATKAYLSVTHRFDNRRELLCKPEARIVMRAMEGIALSQRSQIAVTAGRRRTAANFAHGDARLEHGGHFRGLGHLGGNKIVGSAAR